jgi:peroxiredoxin
MHIITALFMVFFSFTSLAKPIAEGANNINPLLNGQQLPDIQVTTIDNKKVSLATFLNKQKTVIFFYRGGWCPFCNVQMGQLQKIEPDLIKMGFKLVGVSTDSTDDLKKSVQTHQLSYQLLSDYHSNISQAFGLAYFGSKSTTERYLAGLNLSNPLQKNEAGDERLVLPAPAVYIVDAKGLVQFNYVNPNFKVRLHEELLLKAASLVK